MNAKESDNSLFEKTITSDKIFSGTLLHVYKDQVLLPDGKQSGREWIDHPGAAAILPVLQNGDVQLVRQFRYPLKQDFLEVPAGKIDSGEDPFVTAKRELHEESGVSAGQWVSLGAFHPCIGYTNEVIYLYLAWDLELSANHVDADEFLAPVRVPFYQAVNAVHSGDITDGKSIALLLKAEKWWQQNAPFKISTS